MTDDDNALEQTWPESCKLITARWNLLTDNDARSVNGDCDLLVALLQERYGYPPERARRECQSLLDELEATLCLRPDDRRAASATSATPPSTPFLQKEAS